MIEEHGIGGKGNLGQIIEKYYFSYAPNSISEPDFPEAGLELKTSPLKRLKRGGFAAKERLVLNIINYMEVHKEEFETSTLWKKNARLLLIFYLHEPDTDLLDYRLKLIAEWNYPETDLKVIRHDWNTINDKVKAGKAHEISEGDTFYLGACTKGSTAIKSFREQPFSHKKAKQRAYSLKQGYVNHIIANISGEEDEKYGRIIARPQILEASPSIEKTILSMFEPFYGKSAREVQLQLGLDIKQKSKGYYASLTKAMLGIDLDKEIEEFEKAGICREQIKTVRVETDDRIRESVSFPAFSFSRIYNHNWIDSNLKDIIERKFLFLFFKMHKGEYRFNGAKFWNMPFEERNEMRKVWLRTKEVIQKGKIVRELKRNKKGKIYRLNNFPKMIESPVGHVRPHGRDSKDTNPLPVRDEMTDEIAFTKQSFWINSDYVRDNIFHEKYL
jgi:DNA mismatch repair protein MutH